jgi:hypothetical protein
VVRDRVDLGLAVRVGPIHRAGLRLLGLRLVDRPPVGQRPVDLVDPMDLAALHLVGPRLAVQHLVDRRLAVLVGLMDPAVLRLVARVVLLGLVVLVVLVVGRVGLDRMDPAVPVVPNMAAPVAPSMVARAGLGRAGLDLEVQAAPVVLVALNMAGRVGLVAPVDRHRRRMCNTVSTTVVARSGVDRGTRRTASAHPITARHPHHRNAASGGTMGHLRAVRHPTGTAHRLLAVGTGRRLLAAGTVDTMGRLATSVWHRPISGRLPTAASTPYRCSTRFSVDGASGSSATGYRCTDLTAQSPD